MEDISPVMRFISCQHYGGLFSDIVSVQLDHSNANLTHSGLDNFHACNCYIKENNTFLHACMLKPIFSSIRLLNSWLCFSLALFLTLFVCFATIKHLVIVCLFICFAFLYCNPCIPLGKGGAWVRSRWLGSAHACLSVASTSDGREQHPYTQMYPRSGS